jgi:hypothetical protein
MRTTRHAARLFGLGLWLVASVTSCGSSSAGDGSRDSSAGDGSPDSGGGSLALTCAAYCKAIQAACTMSDQQYGDEELCVASCAAFPLGTSGETAGDTLGCRLHYTERAMSGALGAAGANCRKAGPGGDGACGENCGGYCDLVMTFCTASNQAQIYDSRDACLADCATHGTDAPYTCGDPGRTDMGNQVACQLYHAVQGSLAPVNHCLGDLALTALTCRD